MPGKKRRDEHRDELREKIIDAAGAVRERGGGEVSMRKIAEKVGYTATALYDHFADKDACSWPSATPTSWHSGRASSGSPESPTRSSGCASWAGLRRVRARASQPLPTDVHDAAPGERTCPTSRSSKGNPDQDAYAFLRATVAEAIGGRAVPGRVPRRRSGRPGPLERRPRPGRAAPDQGGRPLARLASGQERQPQAVVDAMIRGLLRPERESDRWSTWRGRSCWTTRCGS